MNFDSAHRKQGMIYLRIVVLLCLIFPSVSSIHAQQSSFIPDSFDLSGDAMIYGESCFQLTDDYNWSAGSIWCKNPIDLESSFHMELEVMFGCKDEDGADGIVFAFTPEKNITGFPGEGMGFAGLIPSVGVEMDTWTNHHLGDPYEDHVAIMKNGQVHHGASLAGPILLENIEDCKNHGFSIIWDALSKQLSVHLDGKQVIEKDMDIISDVFNGSTSTYWGITAATGQFNNRQSVCLKKLDKVIPLDRLQFSQSLVDQLLNGKKIVLRNQKFDSGSSSLSQQSIPDLNRLLNLLNDNPQLSITIIGYTDNVGNADKNQHLSFLRTNSIAQYLKWKGISAKRINIIGAGEREPIADNSNPEGRESNRRIEIFLSIPRT